MKFKVSTIDYCYTKKTPVAVNNIKRQHATSRFFPLIINYNDEIDLSFLTIGESILVIAIKDQDSFEKKVICNAYERVK